MTESEGWYVGKQNFALIVVLFVLLVIVGASGFRF
ncbi:YjcZ family sporulation protein [Priestia aryabhattai]|nr:YjcZ family sporulation protein [Priestia megaterium]